VLSPRWIAAFAVVAVGLFAASFAVARSGRAPAAAAPAARTAAAAPLPEVQVSAKGGRLHRLGKAELPALRRPPKPDRPVTPPVGGTIIDLGPTTPDTGGSTPPSGGGTTPPSDGGTTPPTGGGNPPTGGGNPPTGGGDDPPSDDPVCNPNC
jgi:hypothetical protein